MADKKSKRKSEQGKIKRRDRLLAIVLGVILLIGVITVTLVLVPEDDERETPEVPEALQELGTLDVEDLDLYGGYFEEDVAEYEIECLSGTDHAYTVTGSTIVFGALSESSVYSIKGRLKGNIVIDVGDAYRLDLEMHGFSLVSGETNPVFVQSGDKVTLTAKKETVNYIYDTRVEIAADDDTSYKGAIHSDVDLEIAGKGALTVVSEHNNGIHTKDDLDVKNLTLTVSCVDNALKGNDSVSIEGGATMLIARSGDGIKTANSDISEKGNQRGTVSIAGGTHIIGAACDGIDAAYNVVVDDASTKLSIYTDRYCSASEEVTATAEGNYYLRAATASYRYAVKYYNSESDVLWVSVGESYEAVTLRGGKYGSSTYYYYRFPKNTNYQKLAVYVYTFSQEPGQDEDYYACSSYYTRNDAYDTAAVTIGSAVALTWTNYTTAEGPGMGGHGGGMNEGNSDKGDYSTKGIKASNEILLNAGTITVKSYDDAVHANKDVLLENGASARGNVTLGGASLSVFSHDDGVHADGAFLQSSGALTVLSAYEGVEGNTVSVLGGTISVYAKDDGINGTASTGTSVEIGGGTVYIYCSGDGIDTNSSTSYAGIVFAGGHTVVISTSGGNSAIDTERGYCYTGGSVVAMMPGSSGGGMGGGMTQEAVNCQNFSSVGTTKTLSLAKDTYLTVSADGWSATLKMPCALGAYVIVLGDSGASIAADSETNAVFDANGVCWS